MIPNGVTSAWLRERVEWLGEHYNVKLSMEHNSWKRYAVYIKKGSGISHMLTPEYLTNRELATWISGAWLLHDKLDILTDAMADQAKEQR